MRPPAPPHALAAPHAPARPGAARCPRESRASGRLAHQLDRQGWAAGWVAPVTGMGQWGVGAKTRPQTSPPPRLGRQAPGGAGPQAVGCVGFV